MKDLDKVSAPRQEDNKFMKNFITLALIFQNYELKLEPTNIHHSDSNSNLHT
jgi:hypothetical protein